MAEEQFLITAPHLPPAPIQYGKDRCDHGKRNVSMARIESLEKIAKDLSDQNGKFSKQVETAYQKFQEIAEKAIEGSAQARSLADLQKLLAEQGRKTPAEKV